MSEKKARVWMKPEQIDEMKTAAYDASSYEWLANRNNAVITLLGDTGIRNQELCNLNVSHLHLAEGELYMPTEIQKDYPNEHSPPPAHLALESETVRTLRSYLQNRRHDVEPLFTTRSGNRVSSQAVRDLVAAVAFEADVSPEKFLEGEGYITGGPQDVTPHTFRHSVAYRMIKLEDEPLIKVANRLRHASVSTTEKIYYHFRTA